MKTKNWSRSANAWRLKNLQDDDEDSSDIVPDVDTKNLSALTLLDLFFEG